MWHKKIVLILPGILAASSVLAQQGSEEMQSLCTVEPIFHCAESMDDGSAIGHFGYRTSCPDSEASTEEVYVPIGDDNYFAPAPIDRGQPLIFTAGEHVDEFEAEFSAEEVKQGADWTVLKIGIRVDFSKTQDAFLDCSKLVY